jgi:hypothetical protein
LWCSVSIDPEFHLEARLMRVFGVSSDGVPNLPSQTDPRC